jgi:Aspartyl/Asparaginyl beta-hydroxylase
MALEWVATLLIGILSLFLLLLANKRRRREKDNISSRTENVHGVSLVSFFLNKREREELAVNRVAVRLLDGPAGDDVACPLPNCVRCRFWAEMTGNSSSNSYPMAQELLRAFLEEEKDSGGMIDNEDGALALREALACVFGAASRGCRVGLVGREEVVGKKERLALSGDKMEILDDGRRWPSPTCVFLPLASLVRDERPFWRSGDAPASAEGVFRELVTLLKRDLAVIEEEFALVWNLQFELDETESENAAAEQPFQPKMPFGLVEESAPGSVWSSFSLFNQGTRQDLNCDMCPETERILANFGRFMGSDKHPCVFGHAFFSVMSEGVEVKAHTGPVNFRLRCHVPLFQPPRSAFIDCGPEREHWRKGDVWLLDDSFLHSVSFPSGDSRGSAPAQSLASRRVVLLFDIWHPSLTDTVTFRDPPPLPSHWYFFWF